MFLICVCVCVCVCVFICFTRWTNHYVGRVCRPCTNIRTERRHSMYVVRILYRHRHFFPCIARMSYALLQLSSSKLNSCAICMLLRIMNTYKSVTWVIHYVKILVASPCPRVMRNCIILEKHTCMQGCAFAYSNLVYLLMAHRNSIGWATRSGVG